MAITGQVRFLITNTWKLPYKTNPQNHQLSVCRSFLKSVFVQLDDGTFLQNWLIHSVQLIMDALAVPPRKSVWRPFTKWQNSWMTNTWLTLVFKRRPHKIYGNCTVRWTFGGEAQRVWQRKNKSTRRVLLPKKRPTAQRTGCSLQEVWFTGSPFRCFALVVNWLVSVGRQSLFSDLVLDTPTALAQTVQPYCSVFCSLVTLVLLTETCCKQQASESYSVLSYETNQHNRFRVGVLVPL